MLQDPYPKHYANVEKLKKILMQRGLANMNNNQFSTLAKLSSTNEELCKKIIESLIIKEFDKLVKNIH
ncbi:hypothetical protein AAEX28_09290 [Lentisphaerota bacterium WC36G]|nr:hypothetical protein LJT99_12135 [Lentisphaerae bacterium WC36]